MYVCDPHAPWQRGSNENTNGLLRQYLPKATDLSKNSAVDLKRIQRSLNNRPRKTLGYMTPSEAYLQVVAATRLNPPFLTTAPDFAGSVRFQVGYWPEVRHAFVAGQP
ncbi:MAG: IS30 family transposase [Gaiellales bacterium]